MLLLQSQASCSPMFPVVALSAAGGSFIFTIHFPQLFFKQAFFFSLSYDINEES